ncbi:ribosome biogenesis GTPase YlqF [Dasania marina]|mgnify:CR=1 FL=1|uniref:ribosome biogenesis GTPase YlqF n=1 Tax=Dasania marina TaxID=471499 RepID=UPI0030D7F6CD
MSIHWYPGHMYKANKEMVEVLPQVDIIIELLDARIPYSSSNPAIESLRQNKPSIKLLSKSDLADPEITLLWQQYYESQEQTKTLAISTDQLGRDQQIINLCRKLAPHKEHKAKDILVMITGIPNVGKSTLINSLAGRAVAKTGNEPAITKGQQRINLRNGIMLLDTPGILWPKVENENSSYRLATTGAIKDTAMSYDDVAFFAVDYMLKHYPQRLVERYKLKQVPKSELDFLEQLGAQRGCLRAGGQVDLERVSTIFLHELRAGILGGLSLETPEQVEIEKQQVKIMLEEKAAKKKLRLENNKKTRKR